VEKTDKYLTSAKRVNIATCLALNTMCTARTIAYYWAIVFTAIKTVQRDLWKNLEFYRVHSIISATHDKFHARRLAKI